VNFFSCPFIYSWWPDWLFLTVWHVIRPSNHGTVQTIRSSHQERFPDGHPTGKVDLSCHRTPVGWMTFPDGFSAFPDGFWPTGMSRFLVVIWCKYQVGNTCFVIHKELTKSCVPWVCCLYHLFCTICIHSAIYICVRKLLSERCLFSSKQDPTS
jgi:hypothetical protein